MLNPDELVVVDPDARPRVWLVMGWEDRGADRPRVSMTRYTYSALEAVQGVARSFPGLEWTVREVPGGRRHRPLWLEGSAA